MIHLATLEKVERQTQHSWSEKLSILASAILGHIYGSKFISLKIALLLYCLFDTTPGQIYKTINQMNIMIYWALKIADKEVVGFFFSPYTITLYATFEGWRHFGTGMIYSNYLNFYSKYTLDLVQVQGVFICVTHCVR